MSRRKLKLSLSNDVQNQSPTSTPSYTLVPTNSPCPDQNNDKKVGLTGVLIIALLCIVIGFIIGLFTGKRM